MLLMAALSHSAFAVRAMGGWFCSRQSDGTTIEVTQRGDEWLNYFVTRDGVPLVLDDKGDFCYADAFGFGMKSSGVVAHEQGMRSLDEQRHVRSLADVEAVGENAAAARLQAAMRRATLQPSKRVGKFSGLVILAYFQDMEFKSQSTVVDDYKTILNKGGFTNQYAIGSLRDYFLAQSHGLFDLTFDVVGPIQVSGTHLSYSATSNVRSKLVPEVIKAVPDTVDFTKYDWDDDGEVDQVMIIYAGYGGNQYYQDHKEETGKANGCIWPHEWTVNTLLSRNGVTIGTYACSNELEISDDSYSGIGTIAHEFAHCLGLPDTYDTNYNRSATSTGGLMDTWDLMDGGNYLRHGWVPPNFSAFERAYCGWLEPVVLQNDTTVANMPWLNEKNNMAYKIVNQCSSNSIDEYYILENRQKKGWDSYVPDHGMLIWHIDYNKSVWRSNGVNDNIDHLRCMAICADNEPFKFYTDNKQMKGITYPHTDSEGGTINELTDYSTPAATVFNTNTDGTKRMGKPIRQITETNSLIGFKFFSSNATPVKAVSTAEGEATIANTYRLNGQRMANGSSQGRQVVIARDANGNARKMVK